MKTFLLSAIFALGFFTRPALPALPSAEPAVQVAHDKGADGGKKKKDDEEKEEDFACLLRVHFTS